MDTLEVQADLVIKTVVGNYYANPMTHMTDKDSYWATPANSQRGGAYDALVLTDFANIPHIVEHRPIQLTARVDDSQPQKVRRTSKRAKR